MDLSWIPQPSRFRTHDSVNLGLLAGLLLGVESPSLVAVSLFYKALRQQRKSRNVFGKVHSERYIRQRYIQRLDLGAKLWNACSTSTTSSTSNLLECGKGPFGV